MTYCEEGQDDNGEVKAVDPSLADDPLEAMNFEKPNISEDSDSARNEKEEQYILQKSKKNYLIVRLKEPSFIIEDITNGMNTVLFIENKKKILKNKESGEGYNRARLIDKLKSMKNHEDMVETSFYFTDCEVLQNLCEEMNINPDTNQVAHISKFISTVIPMASDRLEERLLDRISQTLLTMANIDELNQVVEQKGPINVILFNTDHDVNQDEQELQTERILRLIRACKKDCFDRTLFVQLQAKDEFLEQVENGGKTFLIRNGQFLKTPFELRGRGKSYITRTLTMINNEGLDDILMNNNQNYFKIYQNDMKAIISLILNTDDQSKKEAYLKIFKEAAQIHREDRKSFLDRYTFVVTDLDQAEPNYREMLVEVTGEINTDAEVFLFTRGNNTDSYENFKLSENIKGVDDLLDTLDDKIQKYEDLMERKKKIQEEGDTGKDQISENDENYIEIGDVFIDVWKNLRTLPKTDSENSISVRNLLGLMYSNDISLLRTLFYKSEDEDREHNDLYISTGLLQVTGRNFDRLIFNKTDTGQEDMPMLHSFILLVCRNKDNDDEENCLRVGKMLHYLRQNFPKEDAEIRIGIMDHIKNDHRIIERYDIQRFPVLIFFGKNDPKKRGKIFRGKLVVEKVINWLDKKFMDNEGTSMNLTDEHYKQLLIITSKNEE